MGRGLALNYIGDLFTLSINDRKLSPHLCMSMWYLQGRKLQINGRNRNGLLAKCLHANGYLDLMKIVEC